MPYTPPTPGERAYEAWRQNLSGPFSAAMPPWDQLADFDHDRWETVALDAREA